MDFYGKPDNGTATGSYSYRNARGKRRYTLTNDYMFRALLQRSNKVLKYLTCSLKHLHPDKVESVTIENPIVLGESIDNKTYILDVRVRLNDGSIINYEMQVMNQGDWPERSLLYLCRCFDQLQKGQGYLETKPATHIAFLDYTLFPEFPEFYSTYQMLNIKNHHKYSDKFTLSVVDLNRIDLATEEDREWHVDHWASLFKATTWEEFQMLAENNEVLQEAVDTVYQLSQDERVREQCQAREDYERMMNAINLRLENAEAALEAKDREIETKDREIETRDREIETRDREIETKDREIETRDREIETRDREIETMNREIERLRRLLSEQETAGV